MNLTWTAVSTVAARFVAHALSTAVGVLRVDPMYVTTMPRVRVEPDRMAALVRLAQGKRVLHLGCTDAPFTVREFQRGSFLHTKLMQVAEEVWGVDIDEESLQWLRHQGVPNLLQGDIEHLDQVSGLREKSFDVIVASEVMEHLNNPGLFLQSAKPLFSQNTLMVIAVPNAHSFSHQGFLLRGCEFVHPDHNYWFSYVTLTGC